MPSTVITNLPHTGDLYHQRLLYAIYCHHQSTSTWRSLSPTFTVCHLLSSPIYLNLEISITNVYCMPSTVITNLPQPGDLYHQRLLYAIYSHHQSTSTWRSLSPTFTACHLLSSPIYLTLEISITNVYCVPSTVITNLPQPGDLYHQRLLYAIYSHHQSTSTWRSLSPTFTACHLLSSPIYLTLEISITNVYCVPSTVITNLPQPGDLYHQHLLYAIYCHHQSTSHWRSLSPTFTVCHLLSSPIYLNLEISITNVYCMPSTLITNLPQPGDLYHQRLLHAIYYLSPICLSPIYYYHYTILLLSPICLSLEISITNVYFMPSTVITSLPQPGDLYHQRLLHAIYCHHQSTSTWRSLSPTFTVCHLLSSPIYLSLEISITNVYCMPSTVITSLHQPGDLYHQRLLCTIYCHHQSTSAWRSLSPTFTVCHLLSSPVYLSLEISITNVYCVPSTVITNLPQPGDLYHQRLLYAIYCHHQSTSDWRSLSPTFTVCHLLSSPIYLSMEISITNVYCMPSTVITSLPQPGDLYHQRLLCNIYCHHQSTSAWRSLSPTFTVYHLLSSPIYLSLEISMTNVYCVPSTVITNLPQPGDLYHQRLLYAIYCHHQSTSAWRSLSPTFTVCHLLSSPVYLSLEISITNVYCVPSTVITNLPQPGDLYHQHLLYAIYCHHQSTSTWRSLSPTFTVCHLLSSPIYLTLEISITNVYCVPSTVITNLPQPGDLYHQHLLYAIYCHHQSTSHWRSLSPTFTVCHLLSSPIYLNLEISITNVYCVPSTVITNLPQPGDLYHQRLLYAIYSHHQSTSTWRSLSPTFTACHLLSSPIYLTLEISITNVYCVPSTVITNLPQPGDLYHQHLLYAIYCHHQSTSHWRSLSPTFTVCHLLSSPIYLNLEISITNVYCMPSTLITNLPQPGDLYHQRLLHAIYYLSPICLSPIYYYHYTILLLSPICLSLEISITNVYFMPSTVITSLPQPGDLYHQRLLHAIYCHHQSTSTWRSLSPTFTVCHLLSSPIYLSLEISITNVYCMPSTVITSLHQPGDLYHQRLLCTIYCHHQSTSAWRSLSPTFTVCHLLSSPVYLSLEISITNVYCVPSTVITNLPQPGDLYHQRLLYAIYCHHQSTSDWRSLSPTFTVCHLLSSPIYLSMEISITNVYCMPSTVITSLPQPGDLYHQRLLCTIYCHHQSTSAWRSLSPTFTVYHLLSSPIYLSLEISITNVYCMPSTVITNLPQPGDLYHQRLLYAIYCHHQSTSAWRSLSPTFTVYHLLSSPIYLSLEISITNIYCMPSTVITNLPQPGDLYHQHLLYAIYCHHQSTSHWISLSPTFTVYHLLSSPICLNLEISITNIYCMPSTVITNLPHTGDLYHQRLLYAIYCHHQYTSTWRSLSPTFTVYHLLSSPIYLSLEISITNVYCVPSTVITNLPQPGDLYHQRLLYAIYCHHQSTSAWRSLSPTFTVCHLLSSPVYLSLEISITNVYCVPSTVITNLPQPGDLYHQHLLYAIYCHHQSTSTWRSLSPTFTVCHLLSSPIYLTLEISITNVYCVPSTVITNLPQPGDLYHQHLLYAIYCHHQSTSHWRSLSPTFTVCHLLSSPIYLNLEISITNVYCMPSTLITNLPQPGDLYHQRLLHVIYYHHQSASAWRSLSPTFTLCHLLSSPVYLNLEISITNVYCMPSTLITNLPQPGDLYHQRLLHAIYYLSPICLSPIYYYHYTILLLSPICLSLEISITNVYFMPSTVITSLPQPGDLYHQRLLHAIYCHHQSTSTWRSLSPTFTVCHLLSSPIYLSLEISITNVYCMPSTVITSLHQPGDLYHQRLLCTIYCHHQSTSAWRSLSPTFTVCHLLSSPVYLSLEISITNVYCVPSTVITNLPQPGDLYHQRLLYAIYCHHQSTSDWRSLSPTFTVCHLLSSPIYLSMEISITNVYCMPSTVITSLPQPGDLYHQRLLCNIYCHHQSTSAWRSLSPTFTVYHLLSSPIYLSLEISITNVYCVPSTVITNLPQPGDLYHQRLLYAIYCHHQSTSAWRSLSPTFTVCHLLSSPIYLNLEISITNIYCMPSTVITNLPHTGDLYHQRLLCTIYCHHQSASTWRSLSPTFTVCHLLSSPIYLTLEISITNVYCMPSTVITNIPQPGDLYHQRLLCTIYCHHQSTSAWRSLSPTFTVCHLLSSPIYLNLEISITNVYCMPSTVITNLPHTGDLYHQRLLCTIYCHHQSASTWRSLSPTFTVCHLLSSPIYLTLEISITNVYCMPSTVITNIPQPGDLYHQRLLYAIYSHHQFTSTWRSLSPTFTACHLLSITNLPITNLLLSLYYTTTITNLPQPGDLYHQRLLYAIYCHHQSTSTWRSLSPTFTACHLLSSPIYLNLEISITNIYCMPSTVITNLPQPGDLYHQRLLYAIYCHHQSTSAWRSLSPTFTVYHLLSSPIYLSLEISITNIYCMPSTVITSLPQPGDLYHQRLLCTIYCHHQSTSAWRSLSPTFTVCHLLSSPVYLRLEISMTVDHTVNVGDRDLQAEVDW